MTRKKKAKPAPAAPRGSAKPRGLASASAAMREAAREETAEELPSRSRRGRAKKPKPKTRAGKKGIVLYVQPEISLALRRLALDHNSDVQQMGRRALELLFAEYGRSLPAGPADAPVKR